MKIENKGEAFEVSFDSREFTVPDGVFEVTNKELANHIMTKVEEWSLDVIKLGDTRIESIKKVEEVIKQEKKEVKEEVKEDKKETKTKKK